MAQTRTGTHDMYLAISEKGIDRLVRAALCEQWGYLGLPRPVVGGNSLYHFDFRFLAPNTFIAPAVFSDDHIPDEGRDSITVILPFVDSFMSGPSGGFNCLSGEFVLALRLIDDNNIFSPDFSQSDVLLFLANDDPDPHSGDRTSSGGSGCQVGGSVVPCLCLGTSKGP